MLQVGKINSSRIFNIDITHIGLIRVIDLFTFPMAGMSL